MTASARPRSRPRSTASVRSACSRASAARPGQIEAFNINILQTKGSLFATRPTLNNYVAKREDLLATAKDLFDVVAQRQGQDPGQPEVHAQGRREGAPGPGRPQHHGLDHPGAVTRNACRHLRSCPGLDPGMIFSCNRAHGPPHHARARHRVRQAGGGRARRAPPRRRARWWRKARPTPTAGSTSRCSKARRSRPAATS